MGEEGICVNKKSATLSDMLSVADFFITTYYQKACPYTHEESIAPS